MAFDCPSAFGALGKTPWLRRLFFKAKSCEVKRSDAFSNLASWFFEPPGRQALLNKVSFSQTENLTIAISWQLCTIPKNCLKKHTFFYVSPIELAFKMKFIFEEKNNISPACAQIQTDEISDTFLARNSLTIEREHILWLDIKTRKHSHPPEYVQSHKIRVAEKEAKLPLCC